MFYLSIHLAPGKHSTMFARASSHYQPLNLIQNLHTLKFVGPLAILVESSLIGSLQPLASLLHAPSHILLQPLHLSTHMAHLVPLSKRIVASKLTCVLIHCGGGQLELIRQVGY